MSGLLKVCQNRGIVLWSEHGQWANISWILIKVRQWICESAIIIYAENNKLTPNDCLESFWKSLGICQISNPSVIGMITAWYLGAKVLRSFEDRKEVILLLAKLWNRKRVIYVLTLSWKSLLNTFVCFHIMSSTLVFENVLLWQRLFFLSSHSTFYRAQTLGSSALIFL